jgi:hypothetical protein
MGLFGGKDKKMNLSVTEMLRGTSIKCPKCNGVFNPGAITLFNVFEAYDNGATVSAPNYTCQLCSVPSDCFDWYKATLKIRK